MKRMNQVFFVCLCALLACVLILNLAAAQVAPAASVGGDEAASAYAGKDWPRAESLYSALARQDPANPRYWYRLAVSERGNRHYDAALESFEKARTLGASKGLPGWLVDYELASTYAAMGNSPRALQALKTSADGGFSQPARLDGDAEWNALRGDDTFLALAKQIKHNSAPCQDGEFNQFDFWVGDWNVTTTGDGTQAGDSHISKEMDGCVVWENWTGAGGGYGKSYNTYNVNLHRWEQYWVDNSAGTIFFYGNLKDGVMDYWTDDVPQQSGGKLRRHLQFFNLAPDKVRQFSQGSTDGGKTWTVEYDLTYTKRSPAASTSNGTK
jgi:tetratricopeptide (TPR) repeat protein